MKRSLILACILISGMIAYAQPSISFVKNVHDFGVVGEGDGAAIYEFEFTNTGKAPLIIQDVKTTCGCTTPVWTKAPVVPGQKGTIQVSYDVKGRPGIIDKTITVYHNAKGSPSVLQIKGEVKGVDRDPNRDYRYLMGELRVSDKHVSFKRIYTHESSMLKEELYNAGKKEAKVEFVDLPAHIQVKVEPATIPAGGKAVVTFNYDARLKKDWGYVADRVPMVIDGDKSIVHWFTVSASIEEDFSRLSSNDMINLPVIGIEPTEVDFGTVKAGTTATRTIKIKNTGKRTLLIRKISSNAAEVSFTNMPREVGVGKEVEVEVKLDAKGLKGNQSKTITVISNDPRNATVVLRMKAQVE